MEVQPGLGTSGAGVGEVRAGGTAVKSPEKSPCLHWPVTQSAPLSLEQQVNTASYLELPKGHPHSDPDGQKGGIGPILWKRNLRLRRGRSLSQGCPARK